ncbi:hypothetical protein ACH419_26210 [Streptomyces bobili]|uniref:hypothetical protein n=1 Tax=Streptomyces bobili TaxID=67280 RepID=UPI00379AF82C
MGWVERRRGAGRVGTYVGAAAAGAAAQLPAVFVLSWEQALFGDPYGRGYDAAVLGLLLAALVAPLCLPVLGFLHACVQILPGAALGDAVLRGVGGPRWVRHLLGAVAVGLVWAVVGAVVWGWSFAVAACSLAALAVLPLLATAYARVRSTAGLRGIGVVWAVWWRAGLASVALLVLAFPAAALATATGLIEEYEPPQLSAAQLAGVWQDEEGAVLRLLPGGRAELARMPAEADPFLDAEFAVCEGTGTWTVADGQYHDRDGIVVRLDTGSGTGSGCGNETGWTIAGTDRAPELFATFGGLEELRVLTRAF